MLRVWAEELYGTRFAQAFDFGETATGSTSATCSKGRAEGGGLIERGLPRTGRLRFCCGHQTVTVVSALVKSG